MCECCGQHDHGLRYLPEAEKPVNTTPVNERDHSLDLKSENPLRRDVIEADDQPSIMKDS